MDAFSFATTASQALSPYAAYEQELERLAYLTQQQEQQRRRAEAAAHKAALAAYVEEQERRQRQAAFERAVNQEVERRRQQEALEEALAYRTALVRRAQQEREVALRRQAAVEAAQRRAVLIAREQHRRRVEAEQEQRRRVVEARRQQRSRQAELPQSLFQLFLDLASSGLPEQEVSSPTVDAPIAPKPAASPAPAPAPGPTPARAAESTEPALADPEADLLQRRFEREVARQAALGTLNRLAADFESHQATFASPSSLAFQSSPAASPSTPPLAYGKSNAVFFGHEEFLVSLLSKIDAVTSGGDKVIKQARKELVKRVEVELAKLDALKEQEWERQSQRAASEAGDEAAPEVTKASTSAAEVEISATRADAGVPSAAETVEAPAEEPAAHVDTASSLAPADKSPSSAAPVDIDNGAALLSNEPSADFDPASDLAAAAAAADPLSLTTNEPSASPAPLTAESLAALPATPTADDTSALRPPSRASTSSLESDASSAFDRYIHETLRRAKELGERVEAEERAERAPVPASAEVKEGAGPIEPADEERVEEAEHAPREVHAEHDVRTVASTPVPAPVRESAEPLEDDVDEEIDVEATLRRMRNAQQVGVPVTKDAVKQVEREQRDEVAQEDTGSEAGTEEFVVI